MKIINSIDQLKKEVMRRKEDGETIGFVPTMGYLHDGHLALAKAARKENDFVVMSIFVNPTQFGPDEDYEEYPRNEQRDVALAAGSDVDIVFMPDVKEMYPRVSSIEIKPGTQANVLCGKTRPRHFDGVLKVLLKFFNIVNPDRSYFGMKDAQQLAIIETFVEDFNFNTTIERVPTVRESDGLARSSRNVKLTSEERTEAAAIYEALQRGKATFEQTQDVSEVENVVRSYIEEHTSGKIDYISFLAYPSLEPYTNEDEEAIIACAVKFEQTRLIDNLIVSAKG